MYSDARLQGEGNKIELDAHQCPQSLELTLNTVDTAGLWDATHKGKCKADS